MSHKIYNGLDMTSTPIFNLPSPSDPAQPATKGYVDTIFGGWSYKDAVRFASTGNVNITSPGSSMDGGTPIAGDRLLLKDQTTAIENGLYNWNGAATPLTRSTDGDSGVELEAAKVAVEEGTANVGTQWKQVTVNFTIGVGNVVWQSDDSAVPAASETVSGKAELATQIETDAGADAVRIVTPFTLTNWSGRVRRIVGNIGDTAATQFDITHNFNTRNVQIQVYRNSTPWDTIGCDIARPDVNTVRFNFAVAPTASQFSYVIWA